MIEGLKIEVDSAELREHLQKRAAYHEEKASFYAGQVKSLTDGGVGTTGHSNDPVGSLKHSQREHMNKMAYFRFLADHIVKAEVYRIAEHDLQTLEIYERYF